MNGAIAEPWVAISSAPNNTMVIIIGASQNFLRMRKKDQNSTIKLPMTRLSELLLHIRCLAPRRPTLDPVSGRVPIGCEAQWSFSAIGVATRKNSCASMMGLTTFATAPPTFNQSLLGVDKCEGAAIPSNSSRAPAAKIRHTTGGTAPQERFGRTGHHQYAADRPIYASFGWLFVTIVFVQRKILTH